MAASFLVFRLFLLFGIILSLLGSCQATVWVRVGSEKFFRIYSCKLINFILKIFCYLTFFIFFSWGVNLCLFGLYQLCFGLRLDLKKIHFYTPIGE